VQLQAQQTVLPVAQPSGAIHQTLQGDTFATTRVLESHQISDREALGGHNLSGAEGHHHRHTRLSHREKKQLEQQQGGLATGYPVGSGIESTDRSNLSRHERKQLEKQEKQQQKQQQKEQQQSGQDDDGKHHHHHHLGGHHSHKHDKDATTDTTVPSSVATVNTLGTGEAPVLPPQTVMAQTGGALPTADKYGNNAAVLPAASSYQAK